MDSNTYIILVIAFFILFITGFIFSIRYALFYTYQLLVISVGLCTLFLFLTYMTIFFKYPTGVYPVNTNPCPDFWELQKDGTCLINPSNIGSMPPTKMNIFNNGGSIPINGYSLENIPFGYNIADGRGTVDFTDVRWSTYNGGQSRNCALKAWANKNGVIWDGIHNYNSCKT